jgi:hypothetical protein
MKFLTALPVFAGTPAFAHELAHAHAHSSHTIVFAALALIAAAIGVLLALRAMRGPR